MAANVRLVRTGRHSILQGPLVEDVAGKGAESGVHAVLHLQSYGPRAQHYEPLKQALGEPRPRRLLTHHYRAQLAVVSHQHQLSTVTQTCINNTGSHPVICCRM